MRARPAGRLTMRWRPRACVTPAPRRSLAGAPQWPARAARLLPPTAAPARSPPWAQAARPPRPALKSAPRAPCLLTPPVALAPPPSVPAMRAARLQRARWKMQSHGTGAAALVLPAERMRLEPDLQACSAATAPCPGRRQCRRCCWWPIRRTWWPPRAGGDMGDSPRRCRRGRRCRAAARLRPRCARPRRPGRAWRSCAARCCTPPGSRRSRQARARAAGPRRAGAGADGRASRLSADAPCAAVPVLCSPHDGGMAGDSQPCSDGLVGNPYAAKGLPHVTRLLHGGSSD